MELWGFLLVACLLSLIPFHDLVPWLFRGFEGVSSKLDGHEGRTYFSTAPVEFALVQLLSYLKVIVLLDYAVEWYPSWVLLATVVILLLGHSFTPMAGLKIRGDNLAVLLGVFTWMSPLLAIWFVVLALGLTFLSNSFVAGILMSMFLQFLLISVFALDPLNYLFLVALISVFVVLHVREVFRIMEGQPTTLLSLFRRR